jgi:hypothetical protein
MKKVSLLIMILLAASFAPRKPALSAVDKTAKGRIELGGSVSLNYTSYENYSIRVISIMPSLGFFVIPKLALEPRFLLLHESTSHSVLPDYSATDFGAIFNVVYHFEGKGESDIVPFIFGGLGFVTHSGDVGGADQVTMVLPDIGGGFKVFFTNEATMRAELFYQRVFNAHGWKDVDADELGIRAGVSIFVK